MTIMTTEAGITSAPIATVASLSAHEGATVTLIRGATRSVHRVSSGGGSQPRWSRDGRELFYISGKSMMSVPVEKQGTDLAFGQARTLFEKELQTFSGGTAFYQPSRYDVSDDGLFLVLLRATEEPPPPLTLVFHWTELLRK